MTAADQTARTSGHEHCGCCGRQLPKNEVVELGTTPGVFICVGCALGPPAEPAPWRRCASRGSPRLSRARWHAGLPAANYARISPGGPHPDPAQHRNLNRTAAF